MKFAVISHVVHKPQGNQFFAYDPYVREMNLWGKHVDEFLIVAPVSSETPDKIDSAYQKDKVSVRSIPVFDITSAKNLFKALFVIPTILFRIYKTMKAADHIHLRCPGNVGLLGCFVQILFPKKPKTAKYAGNWDPQSKQPLTYRWQKWILSNTFLTKNINVLVYGEWEAQSRNIVPFFTASYSKNEIANLPQKKLDSTLRFLYVGGLMQSKQPLLSAQVIHELYKKGHSIALDIYGDGEQRNVLERYISDHNLDKVIQLHGNQSKSVVKEAYKNANFLVFISRSEGWPKVVAEAMFFQCLPISSAVSCVPFMLDNGGRGSLIYKVDVESVVAEIESYLNNEELYQQKVSAGAKWSQNYTLEYLEEQIEKLLHG